MSDPNSLGELIRERRLAAGLSLGQLANKVGRTAATVRAWERDQHFPASDVVERLAMALDVDVDQIRDLMQREPPSLTVVSDQPDDDGTPSESTSVSGDASIETAEGEGDDDTAEIGAVESAPAAAAEVEAEGFFVAASADELGIIPKVEAPTSTEGEKVDGEEEDESAEGERAEDEGAGAEAAAIAVGTVAAADAVADAEPAEDAAPEAEVPPEPGEPVAPVEPAPQTDDEPQLEEAPTEAIGPPIGSSGQTPAAASTSVVVRAELMEEPNLPPILAPLRTIFDPNRRWLYWIRGALTLVAMLIVLVVLVWATGELFDGIGEVLDTIDSTDTLESDVVPLN